MDAVAVKDFTGFLLAKVASDEDTESFEEWAADDENTEDSEPYAEIGYSEQVENVSSLLTIDIFTQGIIDVPDARLRPSALVEYSQKHFEGKTVKEGEILLIIDEAQRLFNARDWSKSDRAAWNEFFQLHRHFGYDIILVAQFDRMLDRQVRSVIEYEQIHRKVSNYGWRGWLLCALMVAPALFVSVKMWYPMRERVGSEFFRYSKRLGRMYDTFMAFPAVEDSEASGVSV